jgi:hypothetical protein
VRDLRQREDEDEIEEQLKIADGNVAVLIAQKRSVLAGTLCAVTLADGGLP